MDGPIILDVCANRDLVGAGLVYDRIQQIAVLAQDARPALAGRVERIERCPFLALGVALGHEAAARLLDVQLAQIFHHLRHEARIGDPAECRHHVAIVERHLECGAGHAIFYSSARESRSNGTDTAPVGRSPEAPIFTLSPMSACRRAGAADSPAAPPVSESMTPSCRATLARPAPGRDRHPRRRLP